MADEDALFADFMGEIKSVVAAAPVEDSTEVASLGDNDDAAREARGGRADTAKRKGSSEVR